MRRILFYVMGLAILFLNKVRYGVRGYREPRPFAPTDFERAIDYDRQVVDGWLKALQDYTGRGIDGKVVLELGPGADSADVTVSQAAFEHFSDVEKTIKQLSTVVKSGGALL